MARYEMNTPRTIVLYVTPISTINSDQMMNDETSIISQELTGKKKTIVIDTAFFEILIVPSESEANVYTIELYEESEGPMLQLNNCDPYGLNEKYILKLHGWKVEWRQREDIKKVDLVYFHEIIQYRSLSKVKNHVFNDFDKVKMEVGEETNEVREIEILEEHSEKIKSGRAIMARFLARREHNNSVKSEAKKYVANLNWSWHRSSRCPHIQKIVGGLVGDVSGGASNAGSDADMGYDEGHGSGANGGGGGGNGGGRGRC